MTFLRLYREHFGNKTHYTFVQAQTSHIEWAPGCASQLLRRER
jgi:hypothetical protein